MVAPREAGPWTPQQALFAVVEDLHRRLGEARGRGEEGANEGIRGSHRPDPAQPAREEALRVQGALDLGEVAPGEATEPRAVVLVEAPQDVHAEPLPRVRRQPELLACALDQLPDIAFADANVLALHPRHELLRMGGRADVRGAREHLGEPNVALEPLDLRGVDDRRPDAVDELAHRPLLDALLSERRQDVRDVLHEGRIGPHHEHAPELLAVGVEEVRGPMEADRRLPGSRPALDDERRLGPASDEPVLVGLDRRDDVAHARLAAPLELVEEKVAADDRARPVELLVAQVEQAPPLRAEPSAQRDVERALRCRHVERSRRRRLPVDDEQRVLIVVVHPAAPDVERPRRRLEVEPPEAEATLRVLERPEPPRRPRLEGERRDLAVGRTGRALDDGAHAVEALVRMVDVRLLGR